MWIFILILFPATLFYLWQENSHKFSPFAGVKTAINRDIENSSNIEAVELRPMEELSYLSKKEILEKRKRNVRNSKYFSDIENYEPNSLVYQIEDNLPWISAYEIARYGVDETKDISKGPSRHSISINNPEVLISILTPQFNNPKERTKFSEYDYFFPTKVFIDKKSKKIEAHFDITNYFKKRKYTSSEIYIDETNARDFGFNWVYAHKKQNILFTNEAHNAGKAPYQIRGYYHKGFSCKAKNGCNNYSPRQVELEFSILALPSYVEFKMWKEKPRYIMQEPDITYRMVFD